MLTLPPELSRTFKDILGQAQKLSLKSWENGLKTAWVYAPLLVLTFVVLGMWQFLLSSDDGGNNTQNTIDEVIASDGEAGVKPLPLSDLMMPPAIVNISPIELTDFIAIDRPVFDASKVELAVINIVASWCAPCASEMPILQGFSDRNIPVYGIVFRDTPDSVTSFLARWGQPFDRLSLDDTGQHVGSLGVTSVPETFVIDRTSGSILYRHKGTILPTDVQQTFNPIFERYTAQATTKTDKTP